MAFRGLLIALMVAGAVESACGQVTQPVQSGPVTQSYPGGGMIVSGPQGYGPDVLPMTAPGVPAGDVGMPGIEYAGTIAAGDGGQLFPYDRQDPWLHGHYQRVPAYGGFASFRPYNYRHVLSQTQLSAAWGMPHGMPYSQQFWNKYRGSYLNGNLHSQPEPQKRMPANLPATQASYPVQLPPVAVIPGQHHQMQQYQYQQQTQAPARPIHLYPQR